MGRKPAVLSQDDVKSFEIIKNKLGCAGQLVHPGAVPQYASVSAADKFFREAIFALADAEYLQKSFWRNVARQHVVAEENMSRLYVDFNTNELFLRD
jgi:hypothetical protein